MEKEEEKQLTPEQKIEELNKELHELNDNENSNYIATEIIGNGTFGIVYKAKNKITNETVAIKRVFQDTRYKNRELQIMKELNHPNCIKLINYFYTKNKKKEEYLNCVMNYLPETLSHIIRKNHKNHIQMEMILVKIYSYQMLKSLSYIHSKGICHRDIKPQNFLIDPKNYKLVLCDFGSAKILEKNQSSIAYICSRYYRAPELIFGATEYNNQIDVWSIGLVIGELIYGQPIFPGNSPSDQLVEIIKVLGTPNKEQIFHMNPQYKEHKFPNIQPYPWEKVFKYKVVNKEFIDLISKLILYEPNKRLKPMKALCHPFFDELRDKNTVLPNGDKVYKELFEFSQEEILSDPESYEILKWKD